MNNLARLDDRRPVSAHTKPLSLPHTIASVLNDPQFISGPWNAVAAARSLAERVNASEVRATASRHRLACQPCDTQWLKQRLSIMAMAFGHERDPDRMKAWMGEMGRLLKDLPTDILADAIDSAIKQSERGFMPGVGQIRAIADPVFRLREQQALRLEMVADIADGGRTARTTSEAAAKPWESAPWTPAEPEEDLIPADEIETFNRNMRKFGCKMRCDANGKTFELGAKDVDPADTASGGRP